MGVTWISNFRSDTGKWIWSLGLALDSHAMAYSNEHGVVASPRRAQQRRIVIMPRRGIVSVPRLVLPTSTVLVLPRLSNECARDLVVQAGLTEYR